MTDHDHSDPWHICPDEAPRWEAMGLQPPFRVPYLTADLDGWPAVIERVLSRDGRCIYADTGPIVRIGVAIQRGLTDHYCRDAYGEPIPWHRLRAAIRDLHVRRAVELDHIKEELAMGIKAPDDEAHLVVACHGAHHGGLATSDAGRLFSRSWLAALYPVVWATFIERQQLVHNDVPAGLTEPSAGA